MKTINQSNYNIYTCLYTKYPNSWGNKIYQTNSSTGYTLTHNRTYILNCPYGGEFESESESKYF